MFTANPQIQEKVIEILKDPDTKEWTETIDSESARINYQKHLAEYLLYRKSTVQNLIKNFKKDENKETNYARVLIIDSQKNMKPVIIKRRSSKFTLKYV